MLDPRLYLFAAEFFLCAVCFLAVLNVWMDHFESRAVPVDAREERDEAP